jgi:hypothetical protein
MKRKPKREHYQKKLTLYGLTLEQVVDTTLKYKPKKKKSSKRK